MLTYEALIEQTKQRGMPHTKMRGVLREYLHILILKELYKTPDGKKLYFTGGTYLRLIHNMKRFSEDLDFNTDTLKRDKFEDLINKVKIELKRIDIDSHVRFKYWDNIYVAHLVFPGVEKVYGIVSSYSKKGGIIIKIETDRPEWKIGIETQVISGFGEFYPCICTDKGSLFSNKIDALIKKTRGRHIYDVVFMLSNQFPINKDVLTALGINDNPLDVIAKRIQDFSKAELKRQAEGLRPFLFEESEADIIVNTHEVIPQLLGRYKQKLS